ncbi:hypothetical protein [Leptospira idonii]|uniref:DUF1285 domain-containing protein n=1 Tax=Leptospira idonii TaxID=1193500 RepID=A0A4R9M2S2_9LEPT|nr:hypothetical protein [Leptospira idonii]TGN21084.1 hypothetical protein EHS15_00770 [Leptospira idonii]
MDSQTQSSPRKFDSEIRIDQKDRWIFRGNEITQQEILKYFRQNLHQNDAGVYIENAFGLLRENGYLEITGFPCHVLQVKQENGELQFLTDDEKLHDLSNFEIYHTLDDSLIGISSFQDKIKYRFTWTAASDLSEFLEEEGDVSYLKIGDLRMEIPLYEGEIGIPLPQNYG